MKIAGIIPARLNSNRFPGKPLAHLHGKPMIEHVYRRAQRAELIDELYITTCDKEIAVETEKFGGRVIMTSPLHTRGTDRVAEAAEKIDADIIINIQGDEPLVRPDELDRALTLARDTYRDNNCEQCMNLVSSIDEWDVFTDRNVIKAVIDKNDRVLYFSRQPIPTSSPHKCENVFKQIGIYIFYKQFLLKFAKWEETVLEKKESIDMLRILENGFIIKAVYVKDMISVDTPEDLICAEKMLLKDPLYSEIFK